MGGSGTIKEVYLYELEHKTKSLNKELEKTKQHEKFFMNRGDKWKLKAQRYEELLTKNNISFAEDVESTRERSANRALKPIQPASVEEDIGDLNLGAISLESGTSWNVGLKLLSRDKENQL